jgi:rhamnosyltransferase
LNTKKLSQKIGLNTDIQENKVPIAPYGSCFWFRPLALKVLYDYGWDYNDFPPEPLSDDITISHAIERIHPYVVQHEGYYSAWLLSDTFDCIELTNITYMLRELNIACMRIFGVTSGQEQLLENISCHSC